MKKNILFLFLLIWFILHSCKKDKDTTLLDNSNVNNPPSIIFSGITWRDLIGVPMGPVDTTDWRLDDNWCQTEKDLFSNWNYNTNCTINDSIFIFAYPNPTSRLFYIYIGNKDTTTKVEMKLLNQHFEQVFINESYNLNHFYFDLDSLDSNLSDTIFRLYYRFIDMDSCLKCGHGDVLRKK